MSTGPFVGKGVRSFSAFLDVLAGELFAVVRQGVLAMLDRVLGDVMPVS